MQPSATVANLATPADHAACAMLLRGGSKTFQAASFALPADARRAATALYAFCRQADDAVDLGADGPVELRALHDGSNASTPARRCRSPLIARSRRWLRPFHTA